tara:strand:- start:2115 stop:2531 length:417 start_codon:yes stop_codon:yes gene_type:complete
MTILSVLKGQAKQLKQHTLTVYFAARDPRTPMIVRGLALFVAAYAFSPIDLIAAYDGVEITPAEVDDMFSLIKSFNSIKTSMLIDLEKGRELELDAILGSVIARCRMLGKPAQITETLWTELTSKPLPDSLDGLFKRE